MMGGQDLVELSLVERSRKEDLSNSDRGIPPQFFDAFVEVLLGRLLEVKIGRDEDLKGSHRTVFSVGVGQELVAGYSHYSILGS